MGDPHEWLPPAQMAAGRIVEVNPRTQQWPARRSSSLPSLPTARTSPPYRVKMTSLAEGRKADTTSSLQVCYITSLAINILFSSLLHREQKQHIVVVEKENGRVGLAQYLL